MRIHVSVVAVVLAAWGLGCGVGSGPPAEQEGESSPLSARETAAGEGRGGAARASRSDIPSTGPVPEGCVRVEGADIGREGLQLALPGATVTLGSWVAKDGEPGEYVGFSYAVSAGTVDYAVKCGGDTFWSSSSPWLHPAGTGGPEASAISNLTLCPGAGAPPQACTSNAQCAPTMECRAGTCQPIIG